MKFFFRLERVLQLRSKAERERARALAQAMRDEEARRDALAEAAARLGRCGEQIADASGAGSRAGTLRNLGLTVAAAASEVEAAEVSHRAAVDVVEVEQQRFGEARKERRVVERLREQRETAFDQEVSREEQREIDSIAQHRRSTGGTPR